MGWKSNFPEEILSTERIRRQLKIGLGMMNQALTGGTVSLAAAIESAGPPPSNDSNRRNGPDINDTRSGTAVSVDYVRCKVPRVFFLTAVVHVDLNRNFGPGERGRGEELKFTLDSIKIDQGRQIR